VYHDAAANDARENAGEAVQEIHQEYLLHLLEVFPGEEFWVLGFGFWVLGFGV